MTINSEIRKVGPFIGNGTATAFPFTFKVFQASDLEVVKLDVATNVETVLTLNSQYTVTLNVDQDSNPGGTVTLIGGALASGYTLTLTSDVPYLQPTDLTNQGGFYPDVINDALDRATIQIQQLGVDVNRSLKVPVSSTANTELPDPSANELIGWNSTGDGLTNIDPTTLATIVAYATAYADVFIGDGVTTSFVLTRPAGSLYNLDVSIQGVTQEPVRDYTMSGTTITFTTAPFDTHRVLVKYKEGLPNYEGDSQDVRYLPAGTGAVATTVQAKLRETVSVKDFGAVGDGVTDDTAAIQAAINSGANEIIYPSGNYLASNLSLVSNQKHIGAGATLTKPVDGNSFFKGISVAEVEFNGLRFQSTDVAAHCILLQGTLSPASCCEDIKVIDCSVYGGIQLFATYQPTGSVYSTITDAMLAKNIIVADNRCVGTNAAKTSGGIGAIAFYYAKDWIAQGNYVESFSHGIAWWGGDSAPHTGEGLLVNTRKCYNGVINGNLVRNVNGGGIWGSMGSQLAISGNNVRDCNDVGIDLEGCLDSVVSGNYVQDCVNGCLVTYNCMYGNVFTGNECVSTVSGRNIVMHNLFGVSTKAGVEQSQDLVLDGNTFRCTESYDVCYVTGEFIKNLIVTNNTFLNCVVSYVDDQYGGVRFDTYDGNKFTFDNTILTPMKVLESSNCHAGSVIRNNTFETYANQQSNTYCIYQSSYSFSAGESHEISGNTFATSGGILWDYNIYCISDQSISGTVSIEYQVLNNRFAATNNFKRSTTGTMKLIGNIDYLCRPYPRYTLPSSAPAGTWNVGQIAYVELPASGGYIGAVCTVDGTPGTWKTFGAIS